MPLCQVIPKWVETISSLKRHIYRKHKQISSYNKKKDELKTRETLIHVNKLIIANKLKKRTKDSLKKVIFLGVIDAHHNSILNLCLH